MSGKLGFQVGESAPRFYESHVELFMVPFVRSLITKTVKSGDAVLDVACGTGCIGGDGARRTGGWKRPKSGNDRHGAISACDRRRRTHLAPSFCA
jgi:hypothetical protein